MNHEPNTKKLPNRDYICEWIVQGELDQSLRRIIRIAKERLALIEEGTPSSFMEWLVAPERKPGPLSVLYEEYREEIERKEAFDWNI